ncbi:CHAT domain-containing protein [Roseiconus lacunae]|uniref:CHAT domain-containing protein n=1 Tax=Roseiconus lacunae TaxID=2605694 RepID=UPI001E3DA7DD|nr:CHAT domain-containing protein [Roseiconus lacunae]MCD0462923.1 CHAT domain-containing protein [Roseiconus lacunae]
MIGPLLATFIGVCIATNVQTARAQQSGPSGQRYRLNAGSKTIAMSHNEGPVGVHLAENGLMVAFDYASNTSPRMSSGKVNAFVLVDVNTGDEISRMIFGETIAVDRTACSADGRFLVVCDRQSARQFDLFKGVLVRSYPVKSQRSFPVTGRRGSLFVLCDERELSLWDLDDGTLIAQLPPHPAVINGCDFDDRCEVILSGCENMTRSWKISTQETQIFPIESALRDLSVSPDGAKLYGRFIHTVSDQGVASYDTRSGRRDLHLLSHSLPTIDFDRGRLYSVDGVGTKTAIDAIQVRPVQAPDRVRYLPFAPSVRERLQHQPFFFAQEIMLSPDRKFVMVRLEYGRLSQVWALGDSADDLLVEFDESLRHRHVPPPKMAPSKPKSREERFLEEINTIQFRVRELAKQDRSSEAVQAINDLLAAGQKRLRNAPIRHQNLVRNCGFAFRDGLDDLQRGLELFQQARQMAESDGRFGGGWVGLMVAISDTEERLDDDRNAAKTYQKLIEKLVEQNAKIQASRFERMAILAFKSGGSEEAIEWRIKAMEQTIQESGALSSRSDGIYAKLVSDVTKLGCWERLESIAWNRYQSANDMLGSEHPETAKITAHLALLCEHQKKNEQALELMDQSQRAYRDYVARSLSLLSDREQTEFIKHRFEPAFQSALRMAVRLQTTANAAPLATSWLLNAKGTSTRALSERHRIAASSRDPAVADLSKQLMSIREQISSLTMSSLQSNLQAADSSDGAVLRDKLSELRDRESELAWKLGSAGWTEFRKQPWSSLEQLRKSIPQDAVFIDFSVVGVTIDHRAFNEWNRERPGTAEREAKILVMIVPPAGSGEIELREVAYPWDQVSRTLIQLQGCLNGQIVTNNVSATIDDHLRELSSLVIGSLPEHVIKTPRWLISPDNLLWQLPFAALPLPNGRRLIENHEIQYLLSGRDLLAATTLQPNPAALIIADPNYGEGVRMNGDKSEATVRQPFSPLPGTANEAKAIEPYLERLTGTAPTMFLGKKAEESVVKSADRPRYAVFSTHGYSQFRHEDHPLATCGLAFANANVAFTGQGDGVLTGIEILGTDFRGTELVVLSACQTAVGNANNGEGVSGLSHAFRLAGADNVVATLWPIPDQITAELMSRFFEQLSKGKTPAAAMRLAQLTTIKRLESLGFEASPQLWAAFTVTGKPPTSAIVPATEKKSEFRKWRSADGKHTTIAKFLAVIEGQVQLQKQDGTPILVPINKLHSDDQRWVQAHADP